MNELTKDPTHIGEHHRGEYDGVPPRAESISGKQTKKYIAEIVSLIGSDKQDSATAREFHR